MQRYTIVMLNGSVQSWNGRTLHRVGAHVDPLRSALQRVCWSKRTALCSLQLYSVRAAESKTFTSCWTSTEKFETAVAFEFFIGATGASLQRFCNFFRKILRFCCANETCTPNIEVRTPQKRKFHRFKNEHFRFKQVPPHFRWPGLRQEWGFQWFFRIFLVGFKKIWIGWARMVRFETDLRSTDGEIKKWKRLRNQEI